MVDKAKDIKKMTSNLIKQLDQQLKMESALIKEIKLEIKRLVKTSNN